MNIEKQRTGFRFGKFSLKVLDQLGELEHKKRKYKLVKVQTNDGLIYFSLRLYNEKGKFIKQLLFEPEIRDKISSLLAKGARI